MNKKGFTLVELLATIIILGLLALLASTSVTKVIKESKGDLYTTQIELVKSAAEAWGAENINKLPDDGECKFLTIKNLQDYGLIDKDIKNPKTNKEIDNNIKIKISSSKTGYGNSTTDYEINPDSIEGCSHAMPCELVSGETNTIGSKYECEVKQGTKYNFYVLSHEDDGTTNLILDRNINSDGTLATKAITEANKNNNGGIYNLVKWYYGNMILTTYGPVTAMDFLYNATKDWINIPNIQMNYKDEGNMYGMIKTTNNITKITENNNTPVMVLDGKDGYTNLKARMPYFSEVYGEGKCLFPNEENTNYPLWLLNYMHESSYITGDELQNINGINGYWTLSSENGNTSFMVNKEGYIINNDIHSGYGVRPVINVKL